MTCESLRTRRDERAQAAGVETVALGVVVLIGATMLTTTVWAAVDARSTLDNAARDYLRAYSAGTTRDDAVAAAMAAFDRSVGTRWPNNPPMVSHPSEPFGPCRPATVSASITISAVRVPFVGSIGEHTITSVQTELVQPYGDAIEEVPGLGPTACEFRQ